MTVQPHNFAKPLGLRGALKHKVLAWFQGFCDLGGKVWSKHFPYPLECAFRGLESFFASQGLALLPDDGIGVRARLGRDIATMFVFPRPLLLALAGGLVGEIAEELPKSRDLTVVEQSLVEFLLQELILDVLSESWTATPSLPTALDGFEQEPKWTKLFAPEDNMLMCRFSFTAKFGTSEWVWLLPQDRIAALFGESPNRQPVAPDPEELAATVESTVKRLPVILSARLGSADVPLSQLLSLEPGDVVVLDQPFTDPLPVCVEGVVKFFAAPGRIGSRQAVQIVEQVD